MIICKKYKQQIVIQLYENHCPNTVYLKGTGLDGQYKNIHLHQLYILHFTSFSHIITLQCYASVELDFYLQLFKKSFKTATLAK